MIVVDASAALQYAASPGGWGPLDGLEPIGPALLWSEALSALRERRWRGEATRELSDAIRGRLLRAPVRLVAPDGLLESAWQVAEELGWAKTYDAEYVALARQLGCPLVTIDERLKRGAGRLVTVIGPTEL